MNENEIFNNCRDLPEKEKRVIFCYFGFDNSKLLTLAEIAKKFDLSISWVGVLFNRALIKTKKT